MDKEWKVIGEMVSGQPILGYAMKNRVLSIKFSGSNYLEISAAGARLNTRLFWDRDVISE